MEKKFSTRKVFNKAIVILNLIAAAGLFISQICNYISPAVFWPASMICLSYPFLLIINILFVFYWLLQMHRFAFISFIIILTGYRQLTLVYQLKFKSTDIHVNDKNSFSLMSFNVRLFDLYNWTGNLKTRAKIFSFLKSENPHILCFQEYYTSESQKFKFENNNSLRQLLKASNLHVEYSTTLQQTQHWGLATFTAFPIIHQGRILFKQGQTNFGIYTDVLIKTDTVRIINVHLQSNHFKEKEYRFIEAPDSGSNEEILQSSKSVLKLLKKGAIKRSGQVDSLKIDMAASPYPIILCGDFNDPPFSYTYSQLSEKLNDSFLEQGSGTGITLVGTVPFYRIDYILHDDLFQCIDFAVLPVRLSDHRPVMAKFLIREK